MKLVIAVVHTIDRKQLNRALVEGDFRSTKLKSSASFMREGTVSFLIGIEDAKLEDLLALIRDNTQAREEFVEEPQTRTAKFAKYRTQALKIVVGGALVIVLEVEQFYQY